MGLPDAILSSLGAVSRMYRRGPHRVDMLLIGAVVHCEGLGAMLVVDAEGTDGLRCCERGVPDSSKSERDSKKPIAGY